MLRKEMYTWFCVFFYTRQAKADYYIYQRYPPHTPFLPLNTPDSLGVLIHATHPSLPLTYNI